MSLFEDLGGEEAIGRLVDAFYHQMQTDPTVVPLLAVHPDIPRARERLFEFLVGWTGGPALYVQKHGHPRLRARHLHVAIDESMAMMWLYCMEHALTETVASEELREILRGNLYALAHHMRNQEG